MTMKFSMLIVEDDEGLRPSLEQSFARHGYEVRGVPTVAEANNLLKQSNVDIVLLDIKLPDGSGFEVLTTVQELDKETVVIIMTAFPEVKTAVRAMKKGARDYVIKPFELDELHLTVERAMETRTLRRSVRLLKRERQRKDEISEIIGESPSIERVRELIRKVAKTDAPVLVTGETGTGKELVADAIHHLSSRSQGPLVKMNCSAFSEQLMESELFGHEKGAFTDAKEARPGIFEMANGGVLLLDEISEMKPVLQAKLLRVVEGQPFHRVGGQREIRTNVRVIAATNRNLSECVQAGSFRKDLFFRLNVFQINVPPLRERGADVVLFARFFLQHSSRSLRKGSILLTPDVEEVLLAYEWPGNVRELRNVMEHAAILCESGEITISHLPGDIHASAFVSKQEGNRSGVLPCLDEIGRRYVEHVVRSTGGNLSEAARILGISRNTLKAKLHTTENPSTQA